MNVKLNIFIFSIFTDFQTRVLDRYFYQLLIYKFWSVVGLDKKVFLFKLLLFCRKFGQHPSDNHDNFFFAKHTHDNSRAVSRQQGKCVGGSSKEGRRARACMGNPNVQIRSEWVYCRLSTQVACQDFGKSIYEQWRGISQIGLWIVMGMLGKQGDWCCRSSLVICIGCGIQSNRLSKGG